MSGNLNPLNTAVVARFNRATQAEFGLDHPVKPGDDAKARPARFRIA